MLNTFCAFRYTTSALFWLVYLPGNEPAKSVSLENCCWCFLLFPFIDHWPWTDSVHHTPTLCAFAMWAHISVIASNMLCRNYPPTKHDFWGTSAQCIYWSDFNKFDIWGPECYGPDLLPWLIPTVPLNWIMTGKLACF